MQVVEFARIYRNEILSQPPLFTQNDFEAYVAEKYGGAPPPVQTHAARTRGGRGREKEIVCVCVCVSESESEWVWVRERVGVIELATAEETYTEPNIYQGVRAETCTPIS